MYGLALIAIIAVMGGAIAYIGDKLGTKVGKKKLSIFGLRPKYTSVIVTIITGILISAATLGLLTPTITGFLPARATNREETSSASCGVSLPPSPLTPSTTKPFAPCLR